MPRKLIYVLWKSFFQIKTRDSISLKYSQVFTETGFFHLHVTSSIVSHLNLRDLCILDLVLFKTTVGKNSSNKKYTVSGNAILCLSDQTFFFFFLYNTILIWLPQVPQVWNRDKSSLVLVGWIWTWTLMNKTCFCCKSKLPKCTESPPYFN